MKFLKVWILSLCSCLILIGCHNTKEVVVKLDGECIPIIDAFFGKLQSGNYAKALEDLLRSNSDINPNDSATIDLLEKFKTINEYSGKYVDYKIIKKRGIDDDVAIYSCLVKYQKKFYRFVYIFYKAEKRAVIYKFKFDDAIDIEMEESLKLYVS